MNGLDYHRGAAMLFAFRRCRELKPETSGGGAGFAGLHTAGPGHLQLLFAAQDLDVELRCAAPFRNTLMHAERVITDLMIIKDSSADCGVGSVIADRLKKF